MSLNLIIFILAVVLDVLVLMIVPFKKKKVLTKMKDKLYECKSYSVYFSIFIIVLGFLINVIMYFRNIDILSKIVISLVSVISVFIGSREICFYNKSGVYKNGVIDKWNYIYFEDVISVPFFSYSKEEQNNYTGLKIEFITKSKGSVYLSFFDNEERIKVLEYVQSVLDIE